MDRLTVKTETGAALKLNDPHTEQEVISLFVAAYRAAVDKLAAYEDGGLEPYHIPSILADNHEIIGECKRLKAENYKLRELLKLAVEDMNEAATASNVYSYCRICESADRDFCKRRMQGKNCFSGNGFRWQHADEAEEVLKKTLDNIPAADVQEVRHGKWHIDDDTDGYICRECMHWQPYTTPYCPNCGARMDGDL